jgi:hypothetical protein
MKTCMTVLVMWWTAVRFLFKLLFIYTFILGFTSCILNNENKTLWYELYNELLATQKCVACQLCIPVFEWPLNSQYDLYQLIVKQ